MKKKIAVVAKINGLEFDDRIRKECIELASRAEVFIYVNLDSNEPSSGITSYGIKYEAIHLKTRKWLPSRRFLFIKSLEFYLKLWKKLRAHDLIWAHEVYTYIFPLFTRNNRFVWDLHELPSVFNKKILKPVFLFIERKSKMIIHANPQRIEYLTQIGLIKHKDKHKAIRNYPDNNFVNFTEVHYEFKDFKQWLGNSNYVYLQGLFKTARYPYESVKAIMQSKELKAIVVGRFHADTKLELEQEYAGELSKRIYFTGMIEQLQIAGYMREALCSIVLYDLKNPNNKFCEPNRLYQAIIMDIPVVVGNNPPMEDLVNKYGFGVVLSDSGENIKELIAAIEKIRNNYNYYKNNIEKHKHQIMWENQKVLFNHILPDFGFERNSKLYFNICTFKKSIAYHI